MSFLKGNIQLSENQGTPSRTKKPWSSFIPCCVYLNTKRIQLPDDSDDEQLIDEQDAPNLGPQAYMPNNSIFKDQAPQQILSRNPFARADEEPQEPESQADEPELEGDKAEDGELVEFKNTSSTVRNYDNEPDWTELYQEEEEDRDEELKDTQQVTADNLAEERIPQIAKEVLHLLPLTELSQEIPPNMILKRSSFEKSMYGEEPLTSGSRSNRQSSSTNRFSQISFSSQPKSELSQDPLSTEEPLENVLGDPSDHEKLTFVRKNSAMEDISEEEDDQVKNNEVINKENNPE